MKKLDCHAQMHLAFEQIHVRNVNVMAPNNVICFEQAIKARDAAVAITKEKQVFDRISTVSKRYKW